MSSPIKFRRRFSAFARSRMNRVFGYMVLAGIFSVVFNLNDLGWDATGLWALVTNSTGFKELLNNVQFFLFVEILPFAIIVFLMLITGMAAGGVAGALIVGLLPRALLPVLDGIIFAAIIIVAIEGSGINSYFDTMQHGFVPRLLSFWLLFMCFSTVLWNRLPFGLTYSSQTKRIIEKPVDAVRPHLIPDLAPDQELADMAFRQDTSIVPGKWQPLDVIAQGEDTFDLNDLPGPKPWRQLTYRLSEHSPTQTRLDITTTLNSLSPMALWECWSRPYGEDYSNHIIARLTGQKDNSIYGKYGRKALNKQQKLEALQQPANA